MCIYYYNFFNNYDYLPITKMRAKDKTKAECIKIWQDKWQDVFKNGKRPELFGERDDQLSYIEKMIERIENTDYDK